MSNLHRGPANVASKQVLIDLVKFFQSRIFLEIAQSEKKIAYGGYVCLRIKTESAILIETIP
jgi:hypothetical protein